MTDDATRTNARFRELDAFRGLAALAVVAYHYTYMYGVFYGFPVPVHWSLPTGYYGVHFFFIVSGFVIFMTLQRCRGWQDFVLSRFSRLYPAYWAALSLTFAVGVLAPLPDQSLTLGQGLVNLTMLQGFVSVAPVDGVYWTLQVELQFYIVMLAVFLLGWLRHSEWLAAGWLALAGVYLLVEQQFGRAILPWRVASLLVLPYAHLFIAGILFYRLHRHGATTPRAALLGLCLLYQFLFDGWVGGLHVSGCFALFLLAVQGRLGWIARPWLLWLGAISYPLYLIHQMLGYRLLQALFAQGLGHTASALITLCAALLAAGLITVLIERPALRAIRRRYRGAAGAPAVQRT